MIINLSKRSNINSFLAMDVLARANQAEAAGKAVIHMEVGQPAAPAPQMVLDEAQKWLATGRLGYTDAMGLKALRARIAQHYHEKHNLSIDPARIAVTTGSSAGFNLAFLALFDVGDKVAVLRPGYPAYRNILKALGLQAVEIETLKQDGGTLSEEALCRAHEKHNVKGLLLASPANPTGTMLGVESLQRLCALCEELGIWFISDEIYHGLVYSGKEETALRFNDNAVVINSFSKYYCMTGWRIGWMVLPEQLVRPVEQLAQSLYISAPELSQRAAIIAFDASEELDRIKQGYAENRQLISNAFHALGLNKYFPVDGAFYFYVDLSQYTNNSLDFTRKLLDEAHIAATPGADFDPIDGHHYVRFSFAGAKQDMAQAMERFGNWLADQNS